MAANDASPDPEEDVPEVGRVVVLDAATNSIRNTITLGGEPFDLAIGPPLPCGNGRQDGGEGCDDGNAVDGDGCDSNCTPTGCGNGVQTTGEECDDGDPCTSDGCDGGGACRHAPIGYDEVRQAIEAPLAADPCTGRRVPGAVEKLRRAAEKLLGQAAGAGKAKRARRLLGHAGTALAKAVVKVNRAAGKKIPGDCAAALRSRLDGVRDRIRCLVAG